MDYLTVLKVRSLIEQNPGVSRAVFLLEVPGENPFFGTFSSFSSLAFLGWWPLSLPSRPAMAG